MLGFFIVFSNFQLGKWCLEQRHVLHIWTESQHSFPSDLESYRFLVPNAVIVQTLVKEYTQVNRYSWLENQLLQDEIHNE